MIAALVFPLFSPLFADRSQDLIARQRRRLTMAMLLNLCQALELLDTVLAVIQPPRRTGFGVFPDAPAPGFYSYDAGGSIVRCIAA